MGAFGWPASVYFAESTRTQHFEAPPFFVPVAGITVQKAADFAHSADGLKAFQKVMGFDFVHRSFYGSESDGVDAYALSGIFNRECAGDCVQSTFGQHL